MGTPKTVRLKCGQIRIDGGTQMRVAIDSEVVSMYRECEFELPPVRVVYDGKDYWLWDGFHRWHARRGGGTGQIDDDAVIDCEVMKGSQRDAVLLAAGANATNGLHRTMADKRFAVNALLADPEWSARSDRWIAEQCHVNNHLVAQVRQERAHAPRNPGANPISNETANTSDARGSSPTCERAGKDGKTYDVRKRLAREIAKLKKEQREGKLQPIPDGHEGVPEDLPFENFNHDLDGYVSQFTGLRNQLSSLLIADGAMKQWAMGMTKRGTVDLLTHLIYALNKKRPGKLDPKNPKGFLTIEEIEIKESAMKATRKAG